ncbi:MAG TPA: cytochrome c3 family protein, partial [Dissulfurispiraceae bacterium]
HANKEIMAKYGLSTEVVKSYLQDFHGVTLKFYKKQKEVFDKASIRPIAVCTDCHGIHDISKTKQQGAFLVKANLVKRCQKCHANATENFPDSWVSHYEPSLKNAPLVYLINLAYKVFIPFMIIGLILQILLHVWRYAVNR